MKMHQSAYRLLPIVMTVAMAGPAHAEVVKIDWDSAGGFQHKQEVAPGKFAEVCGKLAKGQSIRWSFQADAPLNFNIHYHEGQKVEYPAKQDGVNQLQGTLPIGLDQDYCWMWTNRSAAAVTVQTRIAAERQP